MIYTCHGSTVKQVTWFDHDTAEIGVVIACEGGTERAWAGHVNNFKADGGIKEIINAARSHRGNVPARYRDAEA